MRQEHRAGEKMFIDFSGDGITIVDPKTGECVVAKLFLAVLGASNLTYVEPVLSEDLPSWTGGHVRALEYFGGVSEIWVPDNLASGVTKANRYEPDLNPTPGAIEESDVAPSATRIAHRSKRSGPQTRVVQAPGDDLTQLDRAPPVIDLRQMLAMGGD